MSEPLYIGEDHNHRWGTNATDGAKDDLAGTYLNAAVVTWALKDAAGVLVTGGTGTLAYVAASNGNYLGVIQSTVTALLTVGQTYYLETTLVQGDFNAFRRLPFQARYRETY